MLTCHDKNLMIRRILPVYPEKMPASCMEDSVVRLSNAITDTCREMQAYPDDSIECEQRTHPL